MTWCNECKALTLDASDVNELKEKLRVAHEERRAVDKTIAQQRRALAAVHKAHDELAIENRKLARQVNGLTEADQREREREAWYRGYVSGEIVGRRDALDEARRAVKAGKEIA